MPGRWIRSTIRIFTALIACGAVPQSGAQPRRYAWSYCQSYAPLLSKSEASQVSRGGAPQDSVRQEADVATRIRLSDPA